MLHNSFVIAAEILVLLLLVIFIARQLAAAFVGQTVTVSKETDAGEHIQVIKNFSRFASADQIFAEMEYRGWGIPHRRMADLQGQQQEIIRQRQEAAKAAKNVSQVK